MFSLVSDVFPKKKVPFANSLLTAGPYLGSAISCLGVILVGSMGWRGVYKIMGLFGAVVGLVQLLTIKEPKRGAMREENGEPEVKEEVEQTSLKDSLGDLIRNPVAWYSTLGASFRFVNMLACDYFYPAYMLLAYPLYKT